MKTFCNEIVLPHASMKIDGWVFELTVGRTEHSTKKGLFYEIKLEWQFSTAFNEREKQQQHPSVSITG